MMGPYKNIAYWTTRSEEGNNNWFEIIDKKTWAKETYCAVMKSKKNKNKKILAIWCISTFKPWHD